ncbi:MULTISPECIES: ABC transporter permease [Shewanella]|jgi:putative ABC transport system permease protein|uniref:ABC transporter permease n=1 Tax=Shewanella TaxID=22 RepID=UPI000C63DC8B|nr:MULTISPECIES: ABC transporter permease [Shewanella]NCQ44383.1 FtsX-like permease family protein [Shewanella frigidimarina]NCO71659.1 FtsX-like permease family protein [Shewanella vesiculosa]NCP35344.1 FtsX-like permease family protein [Shewanella vesiculosa]NCP70019.1 FtsX-like permease family protein [Shewanella vesiculosa]NCP73390.1 FtsX-like permease family protein [Shewanella vesiculosa]
MMTDSSSISRLRLCLRLFVSHYRHAPLQASAILLGIMLAVTLLIGVYATNENAKQSYGNVSELLSQQARLSISHRTESSIDESVYFALANGGFNTIASIEGIATDEQGRLWRVNSSDIIAAISSRKQQNTDSHSSAAITSTNIPLAELLSGQAKVLMSLSQRDRLDNLSRKTDRLVLNKVPVEIIAIDDNWGLGTAILADISLAQPLLNMQGKLSYIAVFDSKPADPNATAPESDEQLIARLTDTLTQAGIDTSKLTFTTRTSEGESLTALTASFHLNLDAMSMLAFVVGLFIAYNGVRYSLMKRQKLLVQIMQQGIDRRTVMFALSLEIICLVFVGCILGFIGGLQLSQWLQPMVAITLEQLYGAKLLPGIWQWQWFVQALILTLSAAFAACIPMLISLIKTPLAQGAQKQPQNQQFNIIHWRQFVIAVLLLLICTVGFAFTEQYRHSLVLLGIISVAIPLLLPQCLHWAVNLLSPFMPKGLWQYVIAETKEIIAPLALAMMAMLLALCANIAMNTLVGSFEITLKKWLDARLHADLYIRPNPNQIDALILLLNNDPKVEAIYDQWTIDSNLNRIETPQTQVPIDLVSRDHLSLTETTVFKITADDFWPEFTQGHYVMISEPLSIKYQLDIGDKIQLSQLNQHTLTVGGIYYDYGNPQGEAIITQSLWQQSQLPAKPISLAVSYQGDITPLQDSISQKINLSSAYMYSQQRIKTEAITIFNKTFSITVVLNSLTLLVAAIGLFSACMMLTQARQAPLARLYALGVSRNQLRIMVLVQMLFIVLLTCLVALPTGALLGYLLIHKVTLQAFGWSIAMVWDWAAYFQVVVIAIVSCLFAVCLPLYWQTRRPLISSLQQEAL